MSFKKVLAAVMCAIIVLGIITVNNLKPEATSTVTVTCDKTGHVEVGETVTLTIAVPAGYYGFDCRVESARKNYFSVESITKTNMFSYCYTDTPNAYTAHCVALGNSANSAGTLFTVTMKVKVANSKINIYTTAMDADDNAIDLPNVTITVAGHDAGTWTVTVPATRTQEGEKVRTCNGCGKTLETVIIPMIGSVKGDISLDGFATQTDYNILMNYMNGDIVLSSEDFDISDMNSDGAVDALDMFYLNRKINGLD